MGTANEDLTKIVNASGFLFQLRVEEEINSNFATHRRQVLAREYKWIDNLNNQEGFIDLVLSAGTNARFVVECKRQIDSTWIFLVEDLIETTNAHLLWTYSYEMGTIVSAWDKLPLLPKSLDSSFCIVRGSGEKDLPMLERTSSILLRSTEFLANQELNFDTTGLSRLPGLRFYFPLIITTAKLKICRYDPMKIDLSTGTIRDAEFDDVNLIRFTKSLSSNISKSRNPKNIQESSSQNQRTVFILNANYISENLSKKWEIDMKRIQEGKVPWM